MFDDTITHQYPHPGGIHLRHDKPAPNLRAASGIILGLAIAANFWIWSYVIVRAFL